ncbi:MAG: hypothetical protein LBP29_08545, partial [Treponema sp.]|nr:hypothetical protein [Treponema sp.]
MKLFYRLLAAVLTAAFVLSCGSDPEPVPAEPVQTEEPAGPQETPVQENAEVLNEPQAKIFDPSSITKEEFDTTKVEVQHLIQKLNDIIKAKNYTSWVSYLGEDYFRLISSREY